MKFLLGETVYKIRQYTPYIITFLIALVLNISIYHYLIFSQQEKDKLILRIFQDNIKTFLLHDLQTALGSTSNNKKFFLLKKFTTRDNKQNISSQEALNSITVNQYAIYIKNKKGERIFDLQEIKEIIAALLPTYIIYKIAINDNNIAIGKNNNQVYGIREDYSINKDSNLLIELGIEIESNYFINNINQIYKTSFTSVIASFVCCSLFLYLYLRVKKKLALEVQQLKDSLYETNKMNKALLLSKEAEQKLKMIFIQKSTERYINQQSDSKNRKEIIINNIKPNDYLFPIRLTDSSSTEIDIKELTYLLGSYFSHHFMHIVLKLERRVDNVITDCAKEVLYQIIFSFIYNLIRFMEEQSSTPKALVVNFTQEKIIISYDSFPLTEQIMISLSEGLLADGIDVFILSCSKIFMSLKEHKLEYKIYSKDKQNLIEIKLNKKVIKQKKANIVKFLSYKKSKA